MLIYTLQAKLALKNMFLKICLIAEIIITLLTLIIAIGQKMEKIGNVTYEYLLLRKKEFETQSYYENELAILNKILTRWEKRKTQNISLFVEENKNFGLGNLFRILDDLTFEFFYYGANLTGIDKYIHQTLEPFYNKTNKNLFIVKKNGNYKEFALFDFYQNLTLLLFEKVCLSLKYVYFIKAITSFLEYKHMIDNNKDYIDPSFDCSKEIKEYEENFVKVLIETFAQYE